MSNLLILVSNVSTFPSTAAIAAAYKAAPLDLAANPTYWPPEANAPEARLLVLEGYSLFRQHPLQPERLRQALFPPEVSRWFVVLSFLPEEELKCYPSAALLDEPGVIFQRLPCPRREIDDALSAANMFTPDELANMARRVGTAIGQAQWSAQRFVTGLRNAPDGPLLSRRLDELERFCQHHWPRYFERTFTELRETNAPRAEEIMADFSERIVPASVYEAFAAFFHGAGKDVSNRGPGPTLAALSAYTASAGMTLQHIENYLCEHQWWDSFQLALNYVRQQLEDVKAAGFNPDEYLPVRFENLERALSAFAQFASHFSATRENGNAIRRAREHLAVLTDGIAAIAQAREFLRAQKRIESPPSPEHPSGERQMLFVDDDYAQWSAILDVVVQQRNWSVTSVGSIEEARRELEQNMTKYDLILLDLGFPSQSVQGHDGVRLLHDTARTIPIIVLTASNSAADIRTAVECLNQGAWEYFTKPNVDWLRLMNEADNLAAAGRLIRDRMQVLPNVPESMNPRVMFYLPMPKGEGLIDSLKEWLEKKYGAGTVAPHVTPATGRWKGEPDPLVLVYIHANMEQQIKPTHHAIFQKAQELLKMLHGEKCLGVEIGTVFYLVYPDEIRVYLPLETAEKASKWPAL